MKSRQADESVEVKKKRVAAYCRVSTNNSDQQDSYIMQISHYTEVIKSNSAYEFAGIFADDGISGTSKAKRVEFLRMIRECEKGKIDMVITKSVSRFARNTLDCVETVRKLKGMGIAVYFENENINTLSAESELFLTTLSSVAQEESMTKSKNIKWRYQKDFEKGIYNQATMPYGYTSSGDEKFIPHPEHSLVVKRIFNDYLDGKSTVSIARGLSDENIATPHNAKYWSTHVTTSILKNERYIGDMLLQKYYTPDNDETFKSKINYGEKTKYYVSNTHTPIISHEDFEKAQALMKLNSRTRNMKQKTYPLTKKVECAVCGSTYVRKISKNKSGDNILWICHNDKSNRPSCSNSPVSEVSILNGYILMLRKLKEHRCSLLRQMQANLQQIYWHDDFHKEIEEINRKILNLSKQSQILFRLRSEGNLDSAVFMEKSDELEQQIFQLKNEKSLLLKYEAEDSCLIKTEMLIKIIENAKLTELEKIDYTELFKIVSKITIEPQKENCFHLLNGLKLTERSVD